MKYAQPTRELWDVMVAPHAGAWIEMTWFFGLFNDMIVAPHAGAWIEIPTGKGLSFALRGG